MLECLWHNQISSRARALYGREKEIKMNINQVSNQWANRPDDQRFLTLEDLKDHVNKRKSESWTTVPRTRELRVQADQEGLSVRVFDPTQGEDRNLFPTHWAFAQMAQYADAPASYLRKLPVELAAINLQWGLEHSPIRDDSLMLAQSNGKHEMRAMTSISYGRIWDSQVVDAVLDVNQDGTWKVPGASYATTNPKRATTLYASDRDVFLFLVDENHPIETKKGEKLFRGFYTWNSEVGSATFGLATFLYRYVCDNRIIWGATNVREITIRHTGGAPERFAYEGQKYLKEYANESVQIIEGQITKAQETDIPLKVDQTVEQWLQERGFTKGVAKASVQTAVAEQGQARSVWDIINGVTAFARSIPHTDARVELERKAGSLMEIVK